MHARTQARETKDLINYFSRNYSFEYSLNCPFSSVSPPSVSLSIVTVDTVHIVEWIVERRFGGGLGWAVTAKWCSNTIFSLHAGGLRTQAGFSSDTLHCFKLYTVSPPSLFVYSDSYTLSSIFVFVLD